jgi:hypothetical protein
MPTTLADSTKQRAIEFLAQEAKLPFDQVAQLYERERAELDLTARVKRFLPIFAFRGVRERLLKRQP